MFQLFNKKRLNFQRQKFKNKIQTLHHQKFLNLQVLQKKSKKDKKKTQNLKQIVTWLLEKMKFIRLTHKETCLKKSHLFIHSNKKSQQSKLSHSIMSLQILKMKMNKRMIFLEICLKWQILIKQELEQIQLSLTNLI